MADLWLFARLHGEPGSAPALPAVVPRLVKHLRRADRQACLFFRRGDDGHAFELWLNSSRGVRGEAGKLLREQTRAGWRLWIDDGVTRPARHRHESGRDVTDELAAVSSDFALAVLPTGAASPDTAFTQAVVHLRGIAAELHDNARLAFLFRCWRQWCAGLSAKERVELAAASGMWAATVSDEPSAALRTYLRATRDVISHQRAGGLPARYLWFAQAHATQDRLAIPAALSAAAALTVRSELAAAPAGMPVLASGAVR